MAHLAARPLNGVASQPQSLNLAVVRSQSEVTQEAVFEALSGTTKHRVQLPQEIQFLPLAHFFVTPRIIERIFGETPVCLLSEAYTPR